MAAWLTEEQKILTEEIQGDWVTAAGTHWADNREKIALCVTFDSSKDIFQSELAFPTFQPTQVLKSPYQVCVLQDRHMAI